jgi:CheY-like chemotaxis protein
MVKASGPLHENVRNYGSNQQIVAARGKWHISCLTWLALTECEPLEGVTLPINTPEVILLVEDNDMVRELVRRILISEGYVIIEARNGREGLSCCQAHLHLINLLLTDVMMPELGGRELAEGARKLRPDLKIVFMSGNLEDAALLESVQQGAPFLEKPFTASKLADKVRSTLNSNSGCAAQW